MRFLSAAALLALTFGSKGQAQTTAVSLPQPEMLGPLSFNPGSYPVETGVMGHWYVDGVLSGVGLVQDHPAPKDRAALLDLSNAQISIQKTDGLVQFYLQLGAYSLPEVGVQYGRLTDASHAVGPFYSFFPQGFVKFAPSAGFTVKIGKLPTLIGPEDIFTFENVNIERGLLWGQEPTVSRGVQADFTSGPVTLNLSLNNGFYSNHYTWISGAATWTLDKSNTVALQGGDNLGHDAVSTTATPLPQNNGSIVDLVFTHQAGKFSITPYLQYSGIPADQRIGLLHAASSYGAAVLINAPLDPAWSLGGRVEYLGTAGREGFSHGVNLLYGPGSGAVSFTLTPAYASGLFFIRTDLSAVAITSFVPGSGFGASGEARLQLRAMVETGVIF
jgi:hypothetical protein